ASLLTSLPLPTTAKDFHEPGTQPLALMNSIVESTNCASCHGYFDEAQEPYRRWASSMMGQAGRDPVFYAALAIANQDASEAGRHVPAQHAEPGAPDAGEAGRVPGRAHVQRVERERLRPARDRLEGPLRR